MIIKTPIIIILINVKKYVKKKSNVQFIDGKNIDIEMLIKELHLIVNTSITEVFPLTLVEGGLAQIFIYVSYDKGNISFLKGGLIAQNNSEMINNIELLINNEFFYERISKEGY